MSFEKINEIQEQIEETRQILCEVKIQNNFKIDCLIFQETFFRTRTFFE